MPFIPRETVISPLYVFLHYLGDMGFYRRNELMYTEALIFSIVSGIS